ADGIPGHRWARQLRGQRVTRRSSPPSRPYVKMASELSRRRRRAPDRPGNVSNDYRSAVSTANAVLPAGSKTFTITATDVANNSTTQSGFSVTVDNTAPTASDIQTTNVSAGTSGLAETWDTMVFTFAEPIDPSSIVS